MYVTDEHSDPLSLSKAQGEGVSVVYITKGGKHE